MFFEHIGHIPTEVTLFFIIYGVTPLAFVLAALGANKETIVEDFDLSNQSYACQIEALTAQVRDMAGQRVGDGTSGMDGNEAIAFICAMVGVSRENFEATHDLIDREYGSLSQYIENQWDFSKEKQQQFRTKYLE